MQNSGFVAGVLVMFKWSFQHFDSSNDVCEDTVQGG